MRQYRTMACAFLLPAALIAAPAEAAQIIQTFQVDGFFTSPDFTLNRFDPALGTLTGVTARLDLDSVLTVQATGTPGGLYSYFAQIETMVTTDSPLFLSGFNLTFGSGELGPSGTVFIARQFGVERVYEATAGELAAFVGTAPIDGLYEREIFFSAFAEGGSAGGGLGGLNTVVTVTYDYLEAAAPIPEPASWALMIGGIGLTGGALRRRGRTRVRFA